MMDLEEAKERIKQLETDLEEAEAQIQILEDRLKSKEEIPALVNAALIDLTGEGEPWHTASTTWRIELETALRKQGVIQ